jgi:hypothetical protein
MSIPPPPPPIGGPGATSAPPSTPAYSAPASPRPSQTFSSGPAKVSRLPLVLGIFAFVVGAGLLFAPGDVLWVDLLGYGLAGFVLTFLLAWDASSQRAGMKDPNFVAAPNQSLALRVLVFAGFVVAIAHIVRIALIYGEVLSDMWGLH